MHRTWLAPDGSDKAPIDTQRKAMGDLLGHAVRFAFPAKSWRRAKASKASYRCVGHSRHGTAAAFSAAHLAAILFPDTLRRLYIVRDNDPAGDGARRS